jgi:hypothetical protein
VTTYHEFAFGSAIRRVFVFTKVILLPKGVRNPAVAPVQIMASLALRAWLEEV